MLAFKSRNNLIRFIKRLHNFLSVMAKLGQRGDQPSHQVKQNYATIPNLNNTPITHRPQTEGYSTPSNQKRRPQRATVVVVAVMVNDFQLNKKKQCSCSKPKQCAYYASPTNGRIQHTLDSEMISKCKVVTC